MALFVSEVSKRAAAMSERGSVQLPTASQFSVQLSTARQRAFNASRLARLFRSFGSEAKRYSAYLAQKQSERENKQSLYYNRVCFRLCSAFEPKKAEYTRQTPGVQRALQSHASQKKLQFQRAATKKRRS